VLDDTSPPDASGPVPLRPALVAATAELASAGVASPRVDAELLAAHVLGVPQGRLATVAELPASRVEAFRRLVAARASRVPLQHLLGTAAFRHLEVAVGPGVFVPRPETELLVDWGLRTLRGGSPTVVDLCSGSGAIALSVALEHPGSVVYAVERAPSALGWLRRNAAGTAVEVVAGDATSSAVLSTLDGTVDLVLCNPPYVPDGTRVGPEVADHDPADAVFGGPDGLDVIRGVVARAAALLRPGGALGIEHDDSHGVAVPRLLAASGRFTDVQDHVDLSGRPRFATGTRLADLPS
jgi:release factor glutamine methyltransferase